MDAKAVAGQAKAADGQGKAAADQGKAVPHDPLRRAELKERRLPGRLSHFEYEQPYRPTVDTAPSGGATIGRRRRLRQQLGDGGGQRRSQPARYAGSPVCLFARGCLTAAQLRTHLGSAIIAAGGQGPLAERVAALLRMRG